MQGKAQQVQYKRAPKGGSKSRLRTLDQIDKRTVAAQVTLRLRDEIIADLGGRDNLSAMELALVENSALLGAMLKDCATAYLRGEPVDLLAFSTLTNAQRRLLADLGLQRRSIDVSPTVSLQRYVAKAGEAAA